MRTFCAEPEGLRVIVRMAGGVCGMFSRASSARFVKLSRAPFPRVSGDQGWQPAEREGLRHRMRQGMMSDERNAGELVGAPDTN